MSVVNRFLFEPVGLGRVAAFRTLVYGFVVFDVLWATSWVGRHGWAPASFYQPIGPDHFLVTMPEPMFALGLGTEFYVVDPAVNPAAAPEVFEELFTRMR